MTSQNARDDPASNEYARRSNAYQRGSDQQRNPNEAQYYHEEQKPCKADAPQRGNLNANGVVLAGRLPDLWRLLPISTRRNDLWLR